MGSRKEEEKNEKIIRGLMKLPPNRRCINCNSLGPQYVCTTFWTFVCMTCSGIHREFTHRVKSVSMSKFTSQEVDALQNAGNQHAREIYLKNWDFQRHRLPDSSNVNQIREFIKIVYVDRRYAGIKSSERPPRDAQSPRTHEDDIRRASSYHSYSQSPPYDYQYEDRRYGKQAAALTRKPGSDKVCYEGKMSSIIYSPGCFSGHAYEDRFANEGSGPRISDFSVSSGGEQFKSDVQSPKFQMDLGISSPSYPRSGSSSSEDVWSQAKATSLETNANTKRIADGIRPPKRTASTQLTDSNFSSLRSYNSGSLVDFISESVQASGSLQNTALGIPRPSPPTRSVSMDLSKPPSASASSVDLFQLPAALSQAPSVELFQSSVLTAALSFNGNPLSESSQPASLDFFVDLPQQFSTGTSDDKSLELLSMPKNEGWATFDTPECLSSAAPVETPASVPSTSESLQEKFDPFSTSNTNMQWLSFENSSSSGPPIISTAPVETSAAVPSTAKSLQEVFDSFSTSNADMQWPSFENSGASEPPVTSSSLWDNGVWNGEGPVSVTTASTKPWNAFEDSGAHPSQGLLHTSLSADNQNLRLRASQIGGSNEVGVQDNAPSGGFDNHDKQLNFSASSYLPPTHPLMGDSQSNGNSCKSTNPFDYPFDSDVDQNNLFLDMSSLQAALPDPLLPATFHHGTIAEPWLPRNAVPPYISSAGEGGLSFISVQSPSSPIQNIQAQEPVAFGGNPFNGY